MWYVILVLSLKLISGPLYMICPLQDFNSECMKTINCLKESQVIISVPGAYSRKPPLGGILP
jgi:hypothetical protein